MTKQPAFRYFKLGLGLLHHLAQARGPGTKSQGTIGQQSSHLRLAYSVALVQFALDCFAWTAVRGPSHARLAIPLEMGYNKTP
jgi:hypothetical protein